MTPDVAAATYLPTWRGEALPEVGREIVMRAWLTHDGRSGLRERQMEVHTARTEGDLLVITAPGDPDEYTLEAGSSLCRWRYQDIEQVQPAIIADAPDETSEVAPDVTESQASPMPDAHDETLVGRIRRFIAVEARLTAAKAEVKALEAEKGELDKTIIDMLVEAGMDSPPGVDGMTVYLSPVYHAKKKTNPDTGQEYTPADILNALRTAKLHGMINEGYNGNTLRSLLREYEESKKQVPDALAQVVSLEKRREVRITPMGAAKRKAAPNRS